MSASSIKPGDVCVVGVGASTAVGSSAPATAAAVRAGVAMFCDHPHLVDRQGDPLVVAKAAYLNDDLAFGSRLLHLIRPAAGEALAALPIQRADVPSVIGIAAPRPGFPAELTATLSTALVKPDGTGRAIRDVEFLANGHSAGLMALGVGLETIQQGTAEFFLAGGVDSYLAPATLEWLEDCEQLHNTINAWGFIPGEAAAFCLLCSSATAQSYALPVLARLVGVATAHEANRIKTETICIGSGLTQAVTSVLQSASAQGPIIDQTICDQNGEAHRAEEFGFTLARTSQWFKDASSFLAPADCWGDVGAASGPLFLILAVFAGRKRYAKGPVTLVWTSSEGGERAAGIVYTDAASRS